MSDPLQSLQDIHLDVLREVGNIGAGHAATSLSILLRQEIQMAVPRVSVVPFFEMDEALGGSENVVVGVFFRVEGDIPGSVFFMLPIESAKVLLSQMMNMTVTELGDFEISALGEIGNILTGSYLTALADLTKKDMQPSVPAIAIDMAGAILNIGLIEAGQVGDYALVVDTHLAQGDFKIDVQFFFLPDPGLLEVLFQSLGVPL